MQVLEVLPVLLLQDVQGRPSLVELRQLALRPPHQLRAVSNYVSDPEEVLLSVLREGAAADL